ncbi:pyruvate formate-lyase 1-activating enzyme, partial [Pseudomonas sp. MWU12-2534b]
MTPPIAADCAAQAVSTDTLGYLHSTESGAGVDGPGMRFVFFTSGCQFRS